MISQNQLAILVNRFELIENSRNYTAEQKKQMIDSLIQQRNSLSRQAMEQLRNQE
jgi:hypothetical protein